MLTEEEIQKTNNVPGELIVKGYELLREAARHALSRAIFGRGEEYEEGFIEIRDLNIFTSSGNTVTSIGEISCEGIIYIETDCDEKQVPVLFDDTDMETIIEIIEELCC